MKVLVYGDWKNSNLNIKSFFTASYKEEDKLLFSKKVLKARIDFVFVGSLVKGKNPLYAIRLVESLFKRGYDVRLRLYGEGIERPKLEQYITDNQLDIIISLEGNQSKAIVQKAYQDSHFVVLPSGSEGWPKAIAEGMFWGSVPVASSVSCVAFMLDYGNRGMLLEMLLEKDTIQLMDVIGNQKVYDDKQTKAAAWSRLYTVDVFEKEIERLLNTTVLK
jgi:glycosyltransferase involved in cell wall biosynthesis